MVFERIVFTFDEQGYLKGGAAYPWTENGGQGNPIDLPTESEQLAILGEIIEQAATVQAAKTEAEQAKKDLESQTQKIVNLEADLVSVRKRLAMYELTSLTGLTDQLKAQGFYDWLASAVQIDPNLLDEVAELRKAIGSSDLESLKSNYAAIADAHQPTIEQLSNWQSVLDDANIHQSFLAFVPTT